MSSEIVRFICLKWYFFFCAIIEALVEATGDVDDENSDENGDFGGDADLDALEEQQEQLPSEYKRYMTWKV